MKLLPRTFCIYASLTTSRSSVHSVPWHHYHLRKQRRRWLYSNTRLGTLDIPRGTIQWREDNMKHHTEKANLHTIVYLVSMLRSRFI